MAAKQKPVCPSTLVWSNGYLASSADDSHFAEEAKGQRVAGGALQPDPHQTRTHPPPRMRIACFVPGNLSIFPVDIDEQRWVADLKKGIRNEKPNRFNNVDADELTLYRVEVDKHCDEQKRIDELERLFRNLNGRTKLDLEQVLSELFGESPPEGKKYYILVQLPEGKSIHCGSVVLMADAPSLIVLFPPI